MRSNSAVSSVDAAGDSSARPRCSRAESRWLRDRRSAVCRPPDSSTRSAISCRCAAVVPSACHGRRSRSPAVLSADKAAQHRKSRVAPQDVAADGQLAGLARENETEGFGEHAGDLRTAGAGVVDDHLHPKSLQRVPGQDGQTGTEHLPRGWAAATQLVRVDEAEVVGADPGQGRLQCGGLPPHHGQYRGSRRLRQQGGAGPGRRGVECAHRDSPPGARLPYSWSEATRMGFANCTTENYCAGYAA